MVRALVPSHTSRNRRQKVLQRAVMEALEPRQLLSAFVFEGFDEEGAPTSLYANVSVQQKPGTSDGYLAQDSGSAIEVSITQYGASSNCCCGWTNEALPDGDYHLKFRLYALDNLSGGVPADGDYTISTFACCFSGPTVLDSGQLSSFTPDWQGDINGSCCCSASDDMEYDFDIPVTISNGSVQFSFEIDNMTGTDGPTPSFAVDNILLYQVQGEGDSAMSEHFNEESMPTGPISTNIQDLSYKSNVMCGPADGYVAQDEGDEIVINVSCLPDGNYHLHFKMYALDNTSSGTAADGDYTIFQTSCGCGCGCTVLSSGNLSGLDIADQENINGLTAVGGCCCCGCAAVDDMEYDMDVPVTVVGGQAQIHISVSNMTGADSMVRGFGVDDVEFFSDDSSLPVGITRTSDTLTPGNQGDFEQTWHIEIDGPVNAPIILIQTIDYTTDLTYNDWNNVNNPDNGATFHFHHWYAEAIGSQRDSNDATGAIITSGQTMAPDPFGDQLDHWTQAAWDNVDGVTTEIGRIHAFIATPELIAAIQAFNSGIASDFDQGENNDFDGNTNLFAGTYNNNTPADWYNAPDPFSGGWATTTDFDSFEARFQGLEVGVETTYRQLVASWSGVGNATAINEYQIS